MKTAFIFGFRKSDTDSTGYLRLTDDGYEIVSELSSATGFRTERQRGRKGWASPEKWCEFFNSEPELSDWTFHTIRRTKNDE